MRDLAVIIATTAFFTLASAYVRACGAIVGDRPDTDVTRDDPSSIDRPAA
ncbi:MAG TPA: hypothetical protein VFZ83_10035 [Acidimicrobiia bacterium]|nr:hypothetical protein [Acidimicrobiia bacterium]